jgi:hypothetical protein
MQAYTNLAAILSLVGLTKPKQHNRYTIGKLSQALKKIFIRPSKSTWFE